MPTALQEVSNYLKNNPGSRIPDAVKATGYKGPPLKIKEGNLTNNRSKVRVAVRGKNGDLARRANLKRSTRPLTDDEKKSNSNQNARKRRLNKQGGTQTIGHRRRVKLTGEQLADLEKRQGTEAMENSRQVLDDAYGGIGDSPGNREIQDSAENNQEDRDWNNVQERLGEMERTNPSPDNHPLLIQNTAIQVRNILLFGASAALTLGKELLFPSFK